MFEKLISETVRDILTENVRDKRVLDYLKSRGYSDYDERMKIIGGIKHDIPNIRLDSSKFLLGICRMFLDGQLRDEQSIRKVDKALKFIHAGGHTDEFDENLNGKSPNDLHEMFREASKQLGLDDRKRSNNQVFNGGRQYRIIPINSYEEAAPYGKYTSWCVTHGKDAFDSYTQGGNRFYFCLKDGFENVPKDDAGAPLNEWGLSMIAVNIDMNGDLTRTTTRYNHDFNGENNPELETTEQLEKVLNVPFYQTFKPYTREELHAMGIILFDDVQGMLDSGVRIEDIFKKIERFFNGFARVELNGKYNFINQERKLISDTWFDNTGLFNEGFALVMLNCKCNYINGEGKLLSDTGFDYAWDFYNGVATVISNGKYNFINQEGKLLSDTGFDYAWNYHDGIAMVRLSGKYNYINQEGKLLSNTWFDWVGRFNNGAAKVKLNGKYNFINQEGNLLSNTWFDEALNFHHGLAMVKLNGKYNFINQEDNLLSNTWFDDIYGFENGLWYVKLDGQWCYIDTHGKLYNEKPPLQESNEKSRLTESLSSKLYHWTSISAAWEILSKDELFCQSAYAGGGADNYSQKYKFYVSFTRTKSPAESFGYQASKRDIARIEFDGDALSTQFAGSPINYWNGMIDKYYFTSDKNGKRHYDTRHPEAEFEDRLFTNKSIIKSIRKYITRVDILDYKAKNVSELSPYSLALLRYYGRAGIVHVYGSLEDFSTQKNEIIYGDDDYKLNASEKLRPTRKVVDCRYLAEFLLRTVGDDKREINRLLDKYGLGECKPDVMKEISKGYTIDFYSSMSTYCHDLSKFRPSKEGQKVLQLISDIMRKKGYNSWQHMRQKESTERSGNQKKEYDYSDKEFTCVEIGYRSYLFIDANKTDFWYMLRLENLKERYECIDRIIFSMDYDGKPWNERFKKYLQHLAHKNPSFGEIEYLFNKHNVSMEELMSYIGEQYSKRKITRNVFNMSAYGYNICPYPTDDRTSRNYADSFFEKPSLNEELKTDERDENPEWIYLGAFLDEKSKAKLLALANELDIIPDGSWKPYCHHMTLAYNDKSERASEIFNYYHPYIGEYVTLLATEIGVSDKAVAVKMEWASPSGNKINHITIAVSPDGKPVDSNKITNWKPLSRDLPLLGRFGYFAPDKRIHFK